MSIRFHGSTEGEKKQQTNKKNQAFLLKNVNKLQLVKSSVRAVLQQGGMS